MKAAAAAAQEQPTAAKPIQAAAAAADKGVVAEKAGVVIDKELSSVQVGLPAGWKAFRDKASGDIYFGNLTTKVCRL